MTDKTTHKPGCEALGGYGHGIGPCSCSEAQPEALRVRKYIDRRRASKGLDREHIHGFDVGDDAEALLLTSDIEALLGRIASLEAQLSARQAAPEGWRLVPVDFVRGFGNLAHNYSLQAIAPDYYWGNERSAFTDAYARCGHDLAELKALLSAAPPPPEREPQKGETND